MKFEPLTILTYASSVESVKLLVFGAKPGKRTDESSLLMIGGGYACSCAIPVDSVLIDELGGRWLLRSEVESGIFVRFIILEEEDAYAGTLK
jgi:hypothetical protein